MKAARPKVIANFAITADGKVSTRLHTPTGFTSAADKRRLQEIRASGDALLVGRNTVKTDNMGMGISAQDLRRERLRRRQAEIPLRVLISNSGNINLKWKLFQNAESPIVVFSTQRMNKAIRAALPANVSLKLFKTRVNISQILRTLKTHYKVRRLICEGGPTLFRSLLEEGIIDEIYITVAPLIFGGREAFTLTGPAGKFLRTLRHFQLQNMQRKGDELFLHYSAKAV